MDITPSVNCKCSVEEEQGLGRLGVDKLKHPMAFFTPKAITVKNASESTLGCIVGSHPSILLPDARVTCFSPPTIILEHSLRAEWRQGRPCPVIGEVHSLLVKLISLPSFVTSKSLILVLGLGNMNQWDVGLKDLESICRCASCTA